MTELIWVAVIAAIPPTLAVFFTARKQERKIAEVHDLANNRLTEALAKIEKLQRALGAKNRHAR